VCGHLYVVKAGERHHRCRTCEHERKYGPSPAAAAPLPRPSPLPIFTSPPHAAHSHLSQLKRDACIVLDAEGQLRKDIAARVGTSVPSVRHWVNHYAEHKNVIDQPRSGRKRKTSPQDDEKIEAEARETKFTTPRRIKRKLGLNVSSRTIDRRLIEVGLFGRVARHKKKFSEEEKGKRLAFAQQYTVWTVEQWMKVLFADEKIFWGEGFWGQVWVRRPKGTSEALKDEYCVDQDPHPDKVNVWGCFCGNGLGYCYIFNENMNGKLLQSILGTHLIESAELHFDVAHAEQWYFLQDNDPKHKSNIVQTWLFNHGIQLIKIPPYSPDLNPIEHLWADLARRVEQYQCETMEELQDIVADEWKATSVDSLRQLVHSMPERCQAVIDANGDHTKY
jgi:transposase